MKHDIDLGVSLYSFTERWIRKPDFGFDDMFRILTSLGVTKFEIVGSQMFANYPLPTRAEIDQLLAACDKHGVLPFSYGGGVDVGRFSDHDLTDQEIINDVTFELLTAHRLGCKYLRGFGVPTHLIMAVAGLAEYYGIRVGFEVHHPTSPAMRRSRRCSGKLRARAHRMSVSCPTSAVSSKSRIR